MPGVLTLMVCVLAPLDHRFPNVADELRMRLLLEQIDNVPEGATAGAGGTGLTVITNEPLAATEGLAHAELEVIIQLTWAPVARMEEVKTGLLLPTFRPLTCH